MLQDPFQGQMQPVQGQVIPFDVHQLLSVYRLGTPKKEYTNNTGSKMLLGVLFIITGIIFTISGLLLLLLLFSPGASSAVLVILAGTVSLVGTGLALFVNYGVSLIRRAQRNRGATVYLCTDGLLLIRGGGAEALRWDQIAEVWKVFTVITYNYGQKAYVLRQFLLRRSDGTTLVLDNAFYGFEEMGAEVEQQVVGRLLPGALAAYYAGHAVPFGPISVHSQGVSVNSGQKAFSWNELDKVRIADGVIYFKGPSLLPLATVPIAQIPNTSVFAALVSAVTNGQKLQPARKASTRLSTRRGGMTWSDKAVAALGYLSPTLGVLIGWPLLALIVFLLGRRKHFARFHFMQSLLFSISSLSLSFVLIKIDAPIGGLALIIYWIFSLIFVILACLGIYAKIPLIGHLSEKFANKRLDTTSVIGYQ
jgi:uncharacterized membrane protein